MAYGNHGGGDGGGFVMEKQYLDLILVPSGLFLMFGYHLFLLYRILKHPDTTVIGYENRNKAQWVKLMMKTPGETSVALSVLSSNLTASNYLATLSITLSSLIGALVGSSTSTNSSSSSSRLFTIDVVYGDTTQATASVKYIILLICFLLAFTLFIHSSRYFVHANFLISTPGSSIDVSFVQRAVIRGGNFWSLGLRALYFATTLMLWIFGPIPMFVSCVLTVMLLHFLDSNYCPPIDFEVFSDQKQLGIENHHHHLFMNDQQNQENAAQGLALNDQSSHVSLQATP